MVVIRHDPSERSRLNSWKRGHEVLDHAGGVNWQTPDGHDYWEVRREVLEAAAEERTLPRPAQ